MNNLFFARNAAYIVAIAIAYFCGWQGYTNPEYQPRLITLLPVLVFTIGLLMDDVLEGRNPGSSNCEFANDSYAARQYKAVGDLAQAAGTGTVFMVYIGGVYIMVQLFILGFPGYWQPGFNIFSVWVLVAFGELLLESLYCYRTTNKLISIFSFVVLIGVTLFTVGTLLLEGFTWLYSLL